MQTASFGRRAAIGARGCVVQRCSNNAARLRPRSATAAASSTSTAATVDALLEAAAGTQRGVKTSPEARARIDSLIADLKGAAAGARTVDDASGTWELVWTTEKETLFIVQNAGWFGTKAGGVYQVIDTEARRLANVITFPPDGAFIVDSSIEVDGPRRINFKFDAAKLKLKSRDVRVPPVGQGWFETVYVDERIRIAEDSRGDTLVVRRDGPPRVFG